MLRHMLRIGLRCKPFPTIELARSGVLDHVPLYNACQVIYILINTPACNMPSFPVGEVAIFQG